MNNNQFFNKIGWLAMEGFDDTPIDLFEHPDKQPPELAAIVEKFNVRFIDEGENYILCSEFLTAVEAIGYTFDYYLDAEPYDLREVTP